MVIFKYEAPEPQQVQWQSLYIPIYWNVKNGDTLWGLAKKY